MPVSPGVLRCVLGQGPGVQARHHVSNQCFLPSPTSSLTTGQTLSKESLSHGLELSAPKKAKDAGLDYPGERLGRRLEQCWGCWKELWEPRSELWGKWVQILLQSHPRDPTSSLLMVTPAAILVGCDIGIGKILQGGG
jgi:hypothetical protein